MELGTPALPGIARGSAGHLTLESCTQRVATTVSLPFAPVWEPIRPGSLFLDLTGTTRLFGPPIDTAARIGREVMQSTGMPQSHRTGGKQAGLATCATTLGRPPQVFSIHPCSEQPFLAPLPTAATPRPSPGTGLASLTTTRGFKSADTRVRLPPFHWPIWSRHSALQPALLHNWALGIDPSPVRPPSEQPIDRAIHSASIRMRWTIRLLLGRLYGLLEQFFA